MIVVELPIIKRMLPQDMTEKDFELLDMGYSVDERYPMVLIIPEGAFMRILKKPYDQDESSYLIVNNIQYEVEMSYEELKEVFYNGIKDSNGTRNITINI